MSPGATRPIPRTAIRACGLALLLGLGACAGSDRYRPAMQVGSNPSSLIDTYLFIRGVALGYSRSGRAGPAEVTRLITYDHAALIAVVSAQLEPTAANRARAETALQVMLTYAGTQDLETVPAPDSPLAAARHLSEGGARSPASRSP